MKILYLAQLLPYPPDAGPKVRMYYTLRYLAQHHAVTLLAFTRPDDRPEALDHLREFCQAVHTVPIVRSRGRDIRSLAASLLNGQPLVIQRDAVPEMARQVDALLAGGKFDAIHSDQLWMAQYALRARTLHSPIKMVLDEHNACFQIFQRLAQGEANPLKRLVLEREWRLLRRYEAQVCARFDQVVTVTQPDQRTLSELARTALPPGAAAPAFTTIPICVDTGETAAILPQPGAQDVLHLGTMFFLPNVEGVMWFGQQVWPVIKAQAPEATFTVVGKNPPEQVVRLASQPAVKVTGYAADVTPYLAQAGCFIVPLHSGGGMRVKIVDAWRWRLPVVSTSIGAEGLEYQDGENILIADGAEAFAQAVVRLLCDPDLNQRLRQNGRRWVETHYDWRQVYPAWDQVYQNHEKP